MGINFPPLKDNGVCNEFDNNISLVLNLSSLLDRNPFAYSYVNKTTMNWLLQIYSKFNYLIVWAPSFKPRYYFCYSTTFHFHIVL